MKATREARSPQAATLPAWQLHALRVLAIWAVLFAAYCNSFSAGLVFDSASVISQDPHIRAVTLPNIRLILTEPYHSAASGLYRPLTTLSYLFNYAVLGNGLNPAGYHWVNLALHAVNVLLAYLVCLRVFRRPGPAFAVAALWGVHPLLTESVTNVVGRADLLAALGVLAGFLCYLRSDSATGRRKWLWLGGMLAAQAIGMFSKESACVLPGIMLLYDLTWRRTEWKERWLAYALVVLPLAAFLWARGPWHVHIFAADNPMVVAGFWTARLTAIKVIGRYLWLFVWPVHLSADYSYNTVPLFGWRPWEWEDAKTLIALAVCVAAVVFAVRRYLTRQPLVFFAGFFFVALLPTSNLAILIGSIMAERFLYLPSFGLAGLVIAAVYALGGRLAGKMGIALGLVCLACSLRSYARNLDWQDERSLWTSAVEVCPQSAKAHFNLGTTLANAPGELPEAIAQFEAALRIDPDIAEAHDNLGNALSHLPGRLPDEVSEFEAALRLKPDYAEAHNNLGNALSHLPGRLPDAVSEFEAALRISPAIAAVHNNLGTALAQMPGRLPDAMREFEAARRVDPDFAPAYSNLGKALLQQGRVPEAIAQFEAALRIQPNDAETQDDFGVVLSNYAHRMPEAVEHFRAALRINPNFALARSNLENALQQVQDKEGRK